VIKTWEIPDVEKKKFIEFLDEMALGRVNKGKKIGENRLCKYISMLRVPFEFWNKSMTTLTLQDVKNFEQDFSSGKIKTKNGEEFADSSKVDTRKALRIYLRWRLGTDRANKLVDWLDTRTQVKTPEFLREEEIELLYRSCRNAKERFLIAVLFDAGCRAEEFLNIRYEDVFTPKDSSNFVKVALKEEYSKTKGRTISLYWKHSVEAVRDYLDERKFRGIKSTEQVYEGTYDKARQFIRRLGLKVLNKPIHFHLFRHSSATYYASRLNRQQLCIRYGWAFSSNMPDVYISRAGMEDKELDERMAGTKIEKIQEDFLKKEQEMKIEMGELRERLDGQESFNKQILENMKKFNQTLNKK